MKTFKRTLVILLIVLILIQFVRPARNISASQSPADISTIYPVSANVGFVLKKACYDCHSNNTGYPWYANVQPVVWWLDDHIKEGKRGLNFSEFASYRIGRQYRKLEEVIDEVKKGDMPLQSYTIVHTDARLTWEEQVMLTSWADAIRDTIRAKYPVDSLIRKKQTYSMSGSF